jgi:hypothetical protein
VPLAIVYGGGGPLATALGMGAADALKVGGFPMADVPAFGTSGGAVAAAATRAGVSHDQVATTVSHVRLPNRRPGYLRALSAELFDQCRDPLLWTSVVRLATGQRTRLCGADHPVSAIVAASCAVPTLAAPERLGRHRYVDGGIRSCVSADLAPAAEHLIVVAPVLAPSFGPFGILLRAQLGAEIRRWKHRNGGRLTVIRIETEFARRIRRWADLFDRGLAAEAYDYAKDHVREALSPGGRLHNGTAD